MCLDGKSKNPLVFLDHLDRSDQLFERIYFCEFHLWFGKKKCSINFSCLNPRFPWPYNLMFDLYWFKSQTELCDSRPNILLSTSFTSQQINHVYTVAIKLEIYMILFPVTVLWNLLLRYKTFHISQLMLPHLFVPFSSSLQSPIFSFDLTKWSFSVFGLQNATRGGDDNMTLHLG